MRSLDVTGDFNSSVDRLAGTDRHIGGQFAVPAAQTDIGDSLIQVFSNVYCFWDSRCFVMKDDIGSIHPIRCIHSVGFRLAALPLITDGLHQPKTVGHSS